MMTPESAMLVQIPRSIRLAGRITVIEDVDYEGDDNSRHVQGWRLLHSASLFKTSNLHATNVGLNLGKNFRNSYVLPYQQMRCKRTGGDARESNLHSVSGIAINV